MKINQLFIKHVDDDMLNRLLTCFNLTGITDRKQFCKRDLTVFGTVAKLNEMKNDIASYYIPCKARLYLTDLTEKRAITVLKQALRLHNYCLWSRERNFKNKKVIFYQVMQMGGIPEKNMMRQDHQASVITFDG